MHKFIIALLVLWGLAPGLKAQEAWTLERCVRYALDHNLDVRQQVLNERLMALQLQQARLAQLPNAHLSGAGGRSMGRSVDPTTNQFVNASYNFLSLNGNADVLLFGWFQKRSQIRQQRHTLYASRYELEQLQDNISLNVATGFLRAVLAGEQVKINEHQVALSEAQLEQTRRFVAAGRVPELDQAQLESQLATDSANLITAIAEHNASMLDLRALLNLDFLTPFELELPAQEPEELLRWDALEPESVYAAALRHFGSVRSRDEQVAASRSMLDAARASQWPQLGLALQSGTTYASTFQEMTGYRVAGVQQSGAYTDINGQFYPVYQPQLIPEMRPLAFGNQLGNNFRQTLSLSLTIPVFNAWQTQYNIRRAKIDVLSNMVEKERVELTLRQDVYKACNDAVNSVHKYNAANRAYVAARRAYEFAQKRYDLGLTNMVEYLTTQNNQYRAHANQISARYDLIFKLKVIDYYHGKDLKL